jgi:hypothetical protein
MATAIAGFQDSMSLALGLRLRVLSDRYGIGSGAIKGSQPGQRLR